MTDVMRVPRSRFMSPGQERNLLSRTKYFMKRFTPETYFAKFFGGDYISHINPIRLNQNGIGNGEIYDYAIQNYPFEPSRNVLDYDGADTKAEIADHSSIQDIWAGGGQCFTVINPRSAGESNVARIFDKVNWLLRYDSESSGYVKIIFFVGFSTTNGIWETTDTIIPLNSDTFIFIDYDSDSISNDPTIYIHNKYGFKTLTEGDGLTRSSNPLGSYNGDSGNALILGNNTGQTRTSDGTQRNSSIISSGNGETLLTADEIETLAKTGVYTPANYTAFYKMDEGEGTTMANTGAGGAGSATITSGTWKKTPPYKHAKAHTAGYFPVADGVDDDVNFGSQSELQITGDLYISISNFRMIVPTTSARIIECGNSAGLDTNAVNNTVYAITIDGTNTNHLRWFHEYSTGNNEFLEFTKFNFIPGEYYNLEFVRDDSEKTVQMYVDGQLEDTVTYTNSATGGSNAELTFFSDNNASFYSNVSMQTTCIADELPSRAVAVNSLKTGDYSALSGVQLLTRMDESSGNYSDDSANGFTGTVTGVTHTQGRIANPTIRNDSGKKGMDLDGTITHITLPIDRFVGGNGVYDRAFSLIFAGHIDDATHFRMISKTNTTNEEFTFTLGATGFTVMNINDVNSTTRIGRRNNSATPTTSFDVIIVTYDGLGSSSGIKLYLNGTRIDDTNNNLLTYNQMSDYLLHTFIGYAPNVGLYADGSVNTTIAVGHEMTQTEIDTITRVLS